MIKMFNFFRKKEIIEHDNESSAFEIEVTASVLAYEIARIDGDISDNVLNILMEEIKAIAIKVEKDNDEATDASTNEEDSTNTSEQG